MKKLTSLILFVVFISVSSSAQNTPKKTQKGHTNTNKFQQMKDLLATPNSQRLASGAPGPRYTQQKVDYEMNITLDDDKKRITGEETITYHNNSEDHLSYLWVQLDQNRRAIDSKTPDISPRSIPKAIPKKFYNRVFSDKSFDGGFKITSVANLDGSDLSHTINQTMMRINLPKALAPYKGFASFEYKE